MRARHLIPVAAALALLAACSAPDRTPVVPEPPATTASAAPAAPAPCTSPATATYAALTPLPPPSALPSGSLEAQIRARGQLVVGVSSDTRLLGARDLKTNAFGGFDIEVARRVAQAVFGDPNKVQFRAISAAQRIPFLQQGANKGGVDMVARAMTMTCDRWSQVAFAGPYFTSYLKVLVSNTSDASGLNTVKGKVCATNGSTTLAKVAGTLGKANAVGVPLTTDCMVLWQQGQVAAIAADDAILAGLGAQDPSAKIVGDTKAESEPYGLAVSKDHPEFVQFVNAVLEQMRKDGTWQRLYKNSGLADSLGDRQQPVADYTRPLP